MIRNSKLKREKELESILKEYFKKDSNRPDFMQSLKNKLTTNRPKNSRYLLEILVILNSVSDEKIKQILLEKLIEEIVLQMVEMQK